MSTTERSQAPKLTDEQVEEVIALSREADTFELKLTIPEEQRFQTLSALEIDPLEAHIRQVFFFDTPGLDLDSAGVVVRGRRTQEKPDDSVVKLRPVDPGELSEQQREAEGFGVEIDAMPGGYVCSASFKGKLSKPHVKAAAGGEAPIHKLFSKEQRAFYAEHAPEGLEIDDLAVLGPIPVLKLKMPPGELGRRLVVELWNYPDGTHILELSTKCEPGEAFQVAAEVRAYLTERGVDLSGEQTTKTRTALEYFAGQLSA
jgi:hypothetical protein